MLCFYMLLCPYFFKVDGDTLCKLDVDWQKMKPLLDPLDTTVGTLCEFGDVWNIKCTLAERLWEDQEEPPINLALEQAAPGDQNQDAIWEMANYAELKKHDAKGQDHRPDLLQAYIQRLEREGQDVPGKPGYKRLLM